MTKSRNPSHELNDVDLEGVAGGALNMKMEVIEVVSDSYERTATLQRGLRSDGDLVQSVPERK